MSLCLGKFSASQFKASCECTQPLATAQRRLSAVVGVNRNTIVHPENTQAVFLRPVLILFLWAAEDWLISTWLAYWLYKAQRRHEEHCADWLSWSLGGIFISDKTRFITTKFAIMYSHIFGEQTPCIKIIVAAQSWNYSHPAAVQGWSKRLCSKDCKLRLQFKHFLNPSKGDLTRSSLPSK